jgi:GTP-binding protein
MHFIDHVKIYLKAGKGGRGAVAFRREKFIEFGGPDGGNGGRGADIVLRVVPGLNTLIDFRYKQHFRAANGGHGQGANRTGHSADTLYLDVPSGTQVFAEDGQTLLYDLTEVGSEVIIAKGGRGGRGNATFKSSTNQAPKQSTPGEEGEELWVWLELKLLSDVGLLGMPNAGKSTFLSKVSAARPKIGNYPFTTLRPQLGVVYVDHQEVVMADLPGLIAGASQGHGLGDRFLKHVERCKVLLHLIDASSEQAIDNYRIIRQELAAYSPELAAKPELIALNKIDLLSPEQLEMLRGEFSKETGRQVFCCSGATGAGIEVILRRIVGEI